MQGKRKSRALSVLGEGIHEFSSFRGVVRGFGGGRQEGGKGERQTGRQEGRAGGREGGRQIGREGERE